MIDETKTELSWDALAKVLGVTRQSLVNWRPLEGAPGDRDPEAWREFMKKTGLGSGKGKAHGTELRDEKLRWEIELLKSKDAKEKRKLIPVEEVNSLLLHIATQGRTLLYQFMETEAPPKLDGMSAAQMRPILREYADTICQKMGDLIKDFEQQ